MHRASDAGDRHFIHDAARPVFPGRGYRLLSEIRLPLKTLCRDIQLTGNLASSLHLNERTAEYEASLKGKQKEVR